MTTSDEEMVESKWQKRAFQYAQKGPNAIGGVLVLLLLTPLCMNLLNLRLTFAIEVLILALAAYGVQMLFGYTGLLSFGHAAFFGIGSLIGTYLYNTTEFGILLILVIAIVAVLVAAAVIGLFCISQYGIYFAILTLAFAEVVRFASLSPLSDYTGGQNGLLGAIVRPELDLGVVSIALNDALNFYLFLVAIIVAWLFLFKKILRSQFGRGLIAIRENEERAASIGYNVQRLKLASFTISGGVTGLAGALYTFYLGYAGPSHLSWIISGELLFIMIVGGAFSFFGALFGATVFHGLEFYLSKYITWWAFVMGVLLIVLIHIAPGGILGVYEKRRDDIKKFFVKQYETRRDA